MLLFLYFQRNLTCNFIQKRGTNFPLLDDTEATEKFFKKFSKLGTDFYDSTNLAEDVKSSETSKESFIEVKSGRAINVYQIVAVCGSFHVRTESIVRQALDLV